MSQGRQDIRIFDRAQIRRNRARAADKIADHNFLHNWALDQLIDRLGVIRRRFPRILLLGARADATRDAALVAAAQGDSLTVMDSAPLLLRGRNGVVGDEEHLPFAPQSFDLVISPMTLQSVNDLPGALIQIRRALKPDGAFLGALAGGDTLTELRSCLMDAELAVRGGVSPRVFPFADRQAVGALSQRAGFALPVVDSETVTVTYGALDGLLRDLRGMGEGNAVAARSRAFLRRDVLAQAARLYAERYADPDGRLRATFEAIFMIGWAPHASQQQPARRGSAQINLADIL